MSPADLKPYQLMQKAADFFERLNVTYRIVGSMASMVRGEARFTNDIDILADLSEEHVDQFELEFPAPDYYISLAAVRTAIQQRRQFNIIHIPSGLKVDVILKKDTEFGRLDILHGQRLKSEGLYDAWFGSSENVILMKLKYFREGRSEKHLRDIASVLLVQGDSINRQYITEWAGKLGVVDEWELVRQRVDDATR